MFFFFVKYNNENIRKIKSCIHFSIAEVHTIGLNSGDAVTTEGELWSIRIYCCCKCV